ncbi:MAG: PEGA domain-containing protein, partial [Thermoanaerobaculia bacterium]
GWWPTVTVGIESGTDAGAYAPRGAWGIVKTDIQPQEAEVWLDGTYVGTANDFDGYPDFLYLKAGSYKLEFRLENYQPLAADLSIASGEFVTMDRKLEIEQGKNALDFFPPKSKGMPLGRFFGPGGKPASARVAVDDDAPIGIDDQADRMPRQRSQGAVVRSNRARLRFSVTPEDAAIYVDDRYVGVGEELNNSQRGLIVDAGTRSVTVSRPGFKTKTVEVTAKVGQPVDVVVDLEKQ